MPGLECRPVEYDRPVAPRRDPLRGDRRRLGGPAGPGARPASWAAVAGENGVRRFHDLTTSITPIFPFTATGSSCFYKVNSAFARADGNLVRPAFESASISRSPSGSRSSISRPLSGRCSSRFGTSFAKRPSTRRCSTNSSSSVPRSGSSVACWFGFTICAGTGTRCGARSPGSARRQARRQHFPFSVGRATIQAVRRLYPTVGF